VKLSTEHRLARLLAMIPWIVAHEGPSVQDVCSRFELTPADLASDIGLLYLCGLHPYTPDLLIEAEIRDARVWVSYADYFSRPLRLTPVEGLGLLTAAQTLLAVPGTDPSGPLARGLAKLAASLGVDDAVRVDLGSAPEPILTALRSAADDHTQIEIDYLSFSRNERTSRVIEPDHVFVAQGQWYVSGWCQLAAAARTFRVDRIAEVRANGLPRTTTPSPHPPQLFTEVPAGGEAVIVLAAADQWVVELYPILQTTSRPDGSTEVRLAVSDNAWLDRLALRLSLDSAVVSGPDGWNGTSHAANAFLQRYSAGSG
jgi:proteasome accessory factor C